MHNYPSNGAYIEFFGAKKDIVAGPASITPACASERFFDRIRIYCPAID